MKIPLRLLEHRVNIQPISKVGSSVSPGYGEGRKGIHALVIDKRSRVVDQRVSSETKGQEILSSAHILLRAEQWVAPGSLVTVWPGTPMERECEVVAAGYNMHSIAPESAQLWVK